MRGRAAERDTDVPGCLTGSTSLSPATAAAASSVSLSPPTVLFCHSIYQNRTVAGIQGGMSHSYRDAAGTKGIR